MGKTADPLVVIPTEAKRSGPAVLSTGNRCGWKRHPPLCHPKWRYLQFSQPATDADETIALPFVIRSGGICSSLNQQPMRMEAPPSPFVIPTEVEGSAVLSTGN
jgi:hypothetical protein